MLAVSDVRVSFGDTVALDGVSCEVSDDEIVAVLGPSGGGKTTLLRVIAGLQRVDAGSVRFDSQDLTSVPVHLRRFGLMFQDYALFPHKNVAGNVGFGLVMQGRPDAEVRSRVAEVLDLVGLGGWEDREIEGLSGGEAQRIALARTLAPRPRLVLLDEPLGSLDRILRERLVGEIREILQAESTPAIYVTHDHDEADRVSDRALIMRAGRIVASGTLDHIRTTTTDPWTQEFVAAF